MNDTTHFCNIELDGNIITRDANGTLIQEFTGNWTILHKIYEFATMSAREKAKAKKLNPVLYIGSIRYCVRHPGTDKKIEINSTQVKGLLRFITRSGKINFGGLDSLVGN